MTMTSIHDDDIDVVAMTLGTTPKSIACTPPSVSVTIQLWSRDVTAETGWPNQGAALPNGSGIWYGAIQGANTAHVYAAHVTYDVITSATCSYAGNNAMNWCP
jgi:hypothetical protein